MFVGDDHASRLDAFDRKPQSDLRGWISLGRIPGICLELYICGILNGMILPGGRRMCIAFPIGVGQSQSAAIIIDMEWRDMVIVL